MKLYKKSVAARKSRKLDDAILYLKQSAANGYSLAQFDLGTCYLDGEGVDKDQEKAVLGNQLPCGGTT